MNERVAGIRSRALRGRWGSNAEIQRLREESFALTEGEPDVIREAKAFAHTCRNRAIVIYENELIVGAESSTDHHPTEPATPVIFNRVSFKSHWPVSDDVQTFFSEGALSGAGNHTTLDYDTLMRIGFNGLIGRIDNRIGRLAPDEDESAEKRDFLTALRIVAEGWIDLSARYGERALSMAAETADENRRRELEIIGRNCSRTPANPPESFWEACQAVWFCFFFRPDAPGRVDQYLYPFYRRDIDSGAITPEFAYELLSCLWIKYFEFAGAQQGVSATQHLTLGGVKPDGTDASNELTHMCLDVTADLRLNRPQVGLRWNRNTPPELLERAVKVLRTHSGNPDFCNDEQIVPALVKIGTDIADARDFSLSGCHEVIITGKAQMGSVEGFINTAKALRIALGLEPALDAGADLSAIQTWDDLWNAFVRSLDLVVDAAHKTSIARDSQAAAISGGSLADSLVVGDCIENARGYTQGGARYNHCNWNAIGIANVADSLAAIRTLVFEENALTLGQFAEILENNWEGHEELRARVVNRLPHFGNDDDGVDAIAARIIEVLSATMKKRTPFRGGEYCLGTLAGGENMHVEFGRLTGATPDGRLHGSPLADSIGPAQGRDTRGVTAMLNSVAKLPHSLLPTATTLNVKLDPQLLDTDAGVGKIMALIEGHFLSGGQQCQFNMVNREMLMEAKRHPERHGNLMVRIAGYSAPFVSLWDDLKDEIIARTEHAV